MRLRYLVVSILVAAFAELGFAWSFDFLCDDAFIAFRYAANWVHHGQIVYNLGERVEGYTSFIWVALLAALHGVGLTLPMAAKLLGAMSAVLLLVGAAQYAKLLAPRSSGAVALLLAMSSGTAPIAAWTLGGLETPLFAALSVLGVVSVGDWLIHESRRRAVAAALLLLVTTLTRPEGALLFACLIVSIGIRAALQRRVPKNFPSFFAIGAFGLVTYLCWRRIYYGDWLPNTFHLKTSGSLSELRQRGIEYLVFFAEEMCVTFVAGTLVLAFLPRCQPFEPTRSKQCHGGTNGVSTLPHDVVEPPRASESGCNDGKSEGREVVCRAVRLYVIGTLGYVASIGGDFLDLYRFLVPTIPLVYGLALARGVELIASFRLNGTELAIPIRRYGVELVARVRSHGTGISEQGAHPAQTDVDRAPRGTSRSHRLRPDFVLGIALLVWYVPHQWELAKRARTISEPARKVHGIEPIGWTATYARRWAATGRWIAAHSKPGDWLAVGAAGAMPFYSGLPNIDTFGLCDRTVARHGTIIGSRPGHQRFAPIDYLLGRAPTFLLISDFATEYPTRFRQDPAWEQRGYVWVEARILPEEHLAPSAFYHYFLVRKDRASELVGLPLVRVAHH